MLLGKIFAYNGYKIILNSNERHDFSIKLPSNQSKFVVNLRHSGNQKVLVSRIWREVSGRDLEIDATKYNGLIVEKSNANATHDGRVIQGPLSGSQLVKGKVYQRLIDNTEGNEVIDLRVTFHGNKIPLVYRKRRPISSRFSNTNSGVDIVEPSSCFSGSELSMLLRFAEIAGLDFGEADVLRDNESGLIWLVDSTQGPAGPPNGLIQAAALDALRRLSTAFDQMLENAAP